MKRKSVYWGIVEDSKLQVFIFVFFLLHFTLFSHLYFIEFSGLFMPRVAKGGYITGNLSLPANYQNFGNFQGIYGILSDDI